MMNKWILIIILFSFFSQAEETNNIITGSWSKFFSKTLSENRKYAVYLPPSYSHTSKSYPVIYIFDGDTTRLKGISGLVESLSSENLARQIPEFIIVSIPNTDRSRDLTPTKSDLTFNGQILDKFPTSGGANKFSQFLENELIPRISKNYRTNGSNTLIGHSFGGLTAAYIMLTKPELFSNYLIIDATFVWDNNYLNKLAKKNIAKLSSKNIKTFIALANNDHLGELGITNKAWGNDFIKRLKNTTPKNIKIDSQYFHKERHGTVEVLAWYYGLKSLFSTE